MKYFFVTTKVHGPNADFVIDNVPLFDMKRIAQESFLPINLRFRNGPDSIYTVFNHSHCHQTHTFGNILDPNMVNLVSKNIHRWRCKMVWGFNKKGPFRLFRHVAIEQKKKKRSGALSWTLLYMQSFSYTKSFYFYFSWQHKNKSL